MERHVTQNALVFLDIHKEVVDGRIGLAGEPGEEHLPKLKRGPDKQDCGKFATRVFSVTV